ncbi:MAG: hypothetical protein WAN48_07470 [Actinomycetes bacterium]
MRRARGSVLALLGSLTLVGALTGGCNGQQKVADVDEVLARTIASVQGQAALAKVGVEVSGPLSCTSAQADAGVTISCTGTSLNGQAVALTGTATTIPGGNTAKGSFTATVDGQQVLTTECLGC